MEGGGGGKRGCTKETGDCVLQLFSPNFLPSGEGRAAPVGFSFPGLARFADAVLQVAQVQVAHVGVAVVCQQSQSGLQFLLIEFGRV